MITLVITIVIIISYCYCYGYYCYYYYYYHYYYDYHPLAGMSASARAALFIIFFQLTDLSFYRLFDSLCDR